MTDILNLYKFIKPDKMYIEKETAIGIIASLHNYTPLTNKIDALLKREGVQESDKRKLTDILEGMHDNVLNNILELAK